MSDMGLQLLVNAPLNGMHIGVKVPCKTVIDDIVTYFYLSYKISLMFHLNRLLRFVLNV